MIPFDKLAKLKELHPEDVQRIEADERRMSDLLKMQEFASEPIVQEFLSLCRKDILVARKMLATNRRLSEEAGAECWHVIDAREWFLKLVSKDFKAELGQLERDLDGELSR